MTRWWRWPKCAQNIQQNQGVAREFGSYRPFVEVLEDRSMPSNVPLLLVPGEVGSFPVGVNSTDPLVFAAAMQRFARHLGLPPTELTADISNFGKSTGYADLIDYLTTTGGYTLGVDFFVVAQDWRLAPAPLDGRNDGTLSRVTVDRITDGLYQNGVDYLGYWLQQAGVAWHQLNPGHDADTPEVDLISHSEGYLITRSYISSPAYGGAYVNSLGQPDHLPTIDHFISLAGPNEGVANTFNTAFHNNWYQPDAATFQSIRFEVFQLAYFEVARLGMSILGPRGKPVITRATIANPITG